MCSVMNISTTQPGSSLFQGTIAHRGARLKAPENTIASFAQAVKDGGDAVELDVQLSKDGELVIMHDATVDRTTNGTGRVDALDLSDLKELDAGSWFSQEFQGEMVPTLQESLDWARGKTGVDIEVKYDVASSIEPRQLAQTIQQSAMTDSVAVTSFDRAFIEKLEAQHPDLETGVLFSSKPVMRKAGWGAAAGLAAGVVAGLAGQGGLVGAVSHGLVGALAGGGGGYLLGTHKLKQAVRETTADAVIPHWTVADRWVVGAAKESGKRASSYTVNNRVVAGLLKRRGVDGIITDRPEDL